MINIICENIVYLDHRLKISAGVRRLYLLSSRSDPPIGDSRFNSGRRLFVAGKYVGTDGSILNTECCCFGASLFTECDAFGLFLIVEWPAFCELL